ncbi:MAG TPA: hypothetical protein VMI31_17525 [Fimbriimonadaceae bacterium]|nr:hypothetical protein [Fimbriimonadaceae bacterium]
MSKRYIHSQSQRDTVLVFLAESDLLADTDLLERCQTLMQNTVVEAGMLVVGALIEASARKLTALPTGERRAENTSATGGLRAHL